MIDVGGRMPQMDVTLATAEGPKPTTTQALFGGKKMVLFAVPGAFTPTCSEQHLPGFVVQSDAILEKGVAGIVCLAVNDPFVLAAWAKATHAEGVLTMLADGSAVLTKALGLEFDLTPRGLGVRSKRYAMVVEDMVVTHLAVEPAGGVDQSGAEAVLKVL